MGCGRAPKGRFPLQSLCPRGRSGLGKSALAGVTAVKNNERFARAGKANVNGNGLKACDFIGVPVHALIYILLIFKFDLYRGA